MKQLITIIFTILSIKCFSLTISCPPDTLYYACSFDDISLHSKLPYSETSKIITLIQLQDEGGNASSECGIKEISYSDAEQYTIYQILILKRTYVLKDSCDKVAQCSQFIYINDKEPPSILKFPQDMYIEGCNTDELETYSALPYSDTTSEINLVDTSLIGISVADNCGIKKISYLDVINGTCPIFIERNFFVNDTWDNVATFIQHIFIDDTTAPLIACPPNVNYEACTVDDIESLTTLPFTTGVSTITLAQLTATGGSADDNCAIKEINYVDHQFGTCPITIIRTFTVIDSCYNTCTCDQTITIDDTTPPEITCPSDFAFEACTKEEIIEFTGLPYSTTNTLITLQKLQMIGGDAFDNCIIKGIDYIDIQTGTSPITISRYFTVTDSCDNTSVCEQIISINNIIPPNFSGPPDTTFEYTSKSEVDSIFNKWINAVTLSEGCEQYFSYEVHDGSENGILIKEVIWTYDDSYNNSVSYTATFIALPLGGILECPPNIELVCIDSPLKTYSEFDDAGGEYISLWESDSLLLVSEDYLNEIYPRVLERTYQIKNKNGILSNTCTQHITINDETDPKLNCPPDIPVSAVDDIPERYYNVDGFIEAGGSLSDNCGVDSTSFALISEFMDTLPNPDILKRTYYIADYNMNDDICLHQIILDYTTGSEFTSKEDFICNIYPNPNNGVFILHLKGVQCNTVSVDIFNSAGKHIYNKELLMGTNSIDYKINLSDQPAGVYHIRISEGVNVVIKSTVIH